MTEKQKCIIDYLQGLRDGICKGFLPLEASDKSFERTEWPYKNGVGGGQMSVIRGETFEKAAVNWSGIWGDSFPMDDGQGKFFATGVSLITHMSNPKAPTVHFNIRYLETEAGSWFGGGFDLTPMGFPYQEDTDYFHGVARESLEPHGDELYRRFSRAAKEYFHIKHYDRERGVGGIFFDHYNSGDFEADYAMWKAVGDNFLKSIIPIYEKRIHESFTEEDRQTQLKKRAHYVEFNLLYDRGTKFGFQSGGNPDAILCSMPPLAAW